MYASNNCVGPGRPQSVGRAAESSMRLPHMSHMSLWQPCVHRRAKHRTPRRDAVARATPEEQQGATSTTPVPPTQPQQVTGVAADAKTQPVYTTSAVPRGSPLEAAVLLSAGRLMQALRKLRWRQLKPEELAANLLFVLGVILVNWGVESFLEFWLGDSVLGSIGCILFGAGVLTFLKVRQVKVSKSLFSAFWN